MPNLAVDAGYTHIFVSNSSISQNEGSTAANGLIDGTYKNSVDIVGLQLTYTMK
jgi:long-subunit fatty acid transport protein